MSKGSTKSYKAEKDNVVRAMLGNYPIKDAKQPFRFVVKQEDIEKGVKKDPHRCAIARAVERYTGVKAIAIFRTIAYIPFDKAGDGNQVIERFHIDNATSRAIRQFDQTGAFVPGEYKFNPPARYCKLGEQGRYKRKHLKELKSGAPKVKATRIPWQNTKPNPKWLGVRNGTGHVTFTLPKTEKKSA